MVHRHLHLIRFAAMAAALWAVPDLAHAQQNTLFGGRGALSSSSGFGTGSTGLGGAAALPGGGMNPTAQAAGLSNSAFGGQAFGNAGQVNGTVVDNGRAMNGIETQVGDFTRDFTGRSDIGRFVGSAQAGGQQVTTGGQRGGQGNFGRGQGMGNSNRNNRSGNQNSLGQNSITGGAGNSMQQRIIRPQQKVAFRYPLPSPAKTGDTLSTRFQKLAAKTPDQKWLQGVSVDAEEGGRVVLRGQVDTPEQRRLAGIMVGLEPGVRSVQNELTVTTGAGGSE